MRTPNPNLVFGYKSLAKLLGSTAGALYVAKTRGRFTLQPLYSIGRVAVFDRASAIAYGKEYEAQKHTTPKS